MGESVDFVWKTEDDLQTSESWKPEPPPKKRRKRFWIITAVFFLLFCLISVIAYSRLNKQANAVSHQLQDEVVAVHQLVLETAVSGDLDLFRSFLYQPEKAWGQTQVNLVRRDLFFNRAPLSIWLDVENAAAPITAEEVTAEFSADLTRVALMVKRPYLAQNEAGEYEAVQMRQTAVYVRKDGTWLLTEPDDAFWGDDLTAESAILTITHPARDAEVAQRLVADLNDLLIDACAADIFICPDDLAISLQFMHQADELPALNRAFELTSRYSTKSGRTYRLFLPTPTLVGLPVDEASYQALYRGYAAQLLAALIVNLNDVTAIPVGQSELTTQLARFQLPLPQPVGFHPRNTAVSGPIPLPEQRIMLFCRNARSPLVHYNMDTAQWQPLLLDGIDFINALYPMPDAAGALITVYAENETQLHWWRPDADLVLVENAQDIYVANVSVLPGSEAQPKYVITYYIRAQSEVKRVLLDESACNETACEVTPVDSFSVASPDGRFRFVGRIVGGVVDDVVLENDTGEQMASFESIFDLIWLDDTHFAYVRMDPFFLPDLPSQSTLVLGEIGEAGVQTKDYDPYELAAFLAKEGEAVGLLIGGIMPGPDGHPLLYLFIREPQRQPMLTYLLTFDPQTETAALYEDLSEYESAVFLGRSPDSHHLVLGLYDSDHVLLNLYDIEQNHVRTYEVPAAWRGSHAWTPDSAWVVINEAYDVRLVAAAYDFERLIAHDFDGCETAVWVNPP